MHEPSPFDKKSGKTIRSPIKTRSLSDISTINTPTTLTRETKTVSKQTGKATPAPSVEQQNTQPNNQATQKPPAQATAEYTKQTEPNQSTRPNTMDQQKIQQNIANFVPEFNGENRTHELSRFIDTADCIYETLNTEQEKKIFDRLIKLRLTGNAYTRISHRNIQTFNDLKDTLNSMYTETQSLDELERRMTSINQSYGESIRNYGYRLIEAIEQYKSGYKTKYNANNIDHTYQTHLDTQAIQMFKKGLNNTILREKVATIKAKNVNEIINETEIIDKMLSATTSNLNDTKPIPVAGVSYPQTPHKPIITCNYCHKPNHTWDICRTRLINERLKNTTQLQPYNNSLPNIQYSSPRPDWQNRQGQQTLPHYNQPEQKQTYRQQSTAPPGNFTNTPRQYHPQQQPNQFTQQSQYQQQPYRSRFTPKFCSHCKTTTGHTFDECRSKFFPKRQPNPSNNQNNPPVPPDTNLLTDSFNKMRINAVFPQQDDNLPTTQFQPGNSKGSDQP